MLFAEVKVEANFFVEIGVELTAVKSMRSRRRSSAD